MKIVTLLLLALIVFSCGNVKDNSEASKKPNIILISADDLGWSDIGCYGSEINYL